MIQKYPWIKWLIGVAIALILLVLLSGLDSERPVNKIEEPVTINA